MGMDITINRENIDSAEARELMEELSAELKNITGDSGQASFDMADMDNPRSLFVIARAKGRAVGCGVFRELSYETAEIKRMYARNKSAGIGSRILAYLEMQAKEYGYGRVVLETRRCNKKAVNFYLNNGYEEIDNYGKYQNMPEAVCFEKKL